MQRWKDYADTYRQWSEILDITRWSILGGEPTLNPDFLEWVYNISTLWPKSSGSIVTNAYYLKPNDQELYDMINRTQGLVRLDIGLHNLNRCDTVLDIVKQWLHGPITVSGNTIEDLKALPNFDQNWKQSYNKIRDPAWPECNTIDDWHSLPDSIQQECREIFRFSPEDLAKDRLGYNLVDSNGVCVVISLENYFHQGALIPNGTSSFGLHSSNPEKAHDICHSKTCHHFDKGQLYKCGQVALFPEIDRQFFLDVSEQDRKLIHDYQPASIDQSLPELENFINSIEQSLPQCKFCPEYYNLTEIFADHGQKINMVKKSTNILIKKSNGT